MKRACAMVGVAVAMIARVASAQSACPAGMSVTVDTAGHCCWERQVWSQLRSACSGIPSCPAGMVVQGEACVDGMSGGGAATTTGTTTATGTTGGSASGTVAVSFRVDAVEHYTIAVRSESTPVQSCEMPCVLHLNPGTASVAVRGPAPFEMQTQIPTTASIGTIHTRTATLLIVGLALVGVGLVPAAIGSVVQSQESCGSSDPSMPAPSDCLAADVALGVGVVLVAAGVVLASNLPTHTLEFRAAESASRVRLVGLAIAPASERGASVGARFEF